MKIHGAKVVPGCISCKNCENICPEIFNVNPQSTIISDKFNQHALKLLMAEKMCPVNVIKVEKEGDYQLDFSNATLKSKTYLTGDVVELIFETTNFSFLPGQYISLQMKDMLGDFSRSYSIASATKCSFTLTVKLLDKGRGSSYLRNLGERSIKNLFLKKTKIQYIGGTGDFVLQDTQSRKVMIATGTGLAPMISMLEALPDNIEKLLIFGVRYETDLFYLNKLKEFKNLEIKICISKPTDKNTKSHRVTDYIDSITGNDEVYICGNPEMVKSVNEKLQQSNHPSENIFYENFTLSQKPISLIKNIIFNGEIPGLEIFHKILIYSSIFGIPLFYYFGLEYNYLGYEILGKNLYSHLFLLTWYAVCFVMLIRPLADIFPKLNILRRLVVLRKGFGIFSASIIVTILIAKWIQFPATLGTFFELSSWTSWMGFVSRISELTAIILILTSNTFSQKILGVWWKRIQKTSYIYFYSGPIIALQYSETVLEYYIPMILLPILWIMAYSRIKLWK